MKPVHVKISTGDNGGSHHSKIEVDGVEVKGLEALELRLDVREPNRVVLHHVAPVVDFDGLAEVIHVPKSFAARVDGALERLKGVPGIMRVPAEPTDPDLVLGDVRRMLEAARVVDVGAAGSSWLSAGRLEQLVDPNMDSPPTFDEVRALVAEVRWIRRDAAAED